MEEVLGMCGSHLLLHRRIVAHPSVHAQLVLPAPLSPKTVNKISSWPITIWTWMSRCGNTRNQEEYVDAGEGAGIEGALGVEGDEEATM